MQPPRRRDRGANVRRDPLAVGAGGGVGFGKVGHGGDGTRARTVARPGAARGSMC